PKVLERLREGPGPAAILKDFEKTEVGIGWRQLAIIDAKGQAAFFNGGNIYPVFKGRVGRDSGAVGNILRNNHDADGAMVHSCEASEDQPRAERLMRAIEAGDAAGGELKQVKSAGLVVAYREGFPFVDLRVGLAPRPVVQLRVLGELYQPTADDYVVRAVDPDRAQKPV